MYPVPLVILLYPVLLWSQAEKRRCTLDANAQANQEVQLWILLLLPESLVFESNRERNAIPTTNGYREADVGISAPPTMPR